MNSTEIFEMTERMLQYGGSFVQSLANTMRYADPSNKQRILDVFPEFVEQYGPNSKFNV